MAKKRARRKVDIPDNETDAAKFIRVVQPRVGKAVKAIGLVGYCTGSGYEYTPAQAKQIIAVLTKAIVNIEKQFAGSAGRDDSFVLDK